MYGRQIFRTLGLLGGALLLAALSALALAAIAQGATPVRSDALVLVDSASDGYADFAQRIQPYLDNFGVPYTVLDIAHDQVPADVADYSLLIVGHRRLDVGGAYLDAAEQAALAAAVSGGTGLVNFDNDLWTSTGTARYPFLQSVFGFGRGGSSTGTGVAFSSAGGGSGGSGGAGTEVTIDCWDDAHQEPVLETTTSAGALVNNDGKWTEFLYSSRRTYPAVFAGANEYENNSLPAMRFYASGIADGEYDVYANLYTQASGRDMRYYFGYSPSATKQYHVDTVGGSGGTAQFTEYRLGSVGITGGSFSLYAQDADLLSGSNDLFGWAWIRLVPAVQPPATTAHYITALHAADESVATGAMRLPSVTLPASDSAVAVTDNQPFVVVTSHGAGHAVQWGSYDWMSHAVLGPVHGLDDLMWRSLAWAARKPFVMQALPPIVTMRVDDGKGPFGWIHTANDFGFKPWVGVFTRDIGDTDAADLSALTNAGLATASIHSFDYTDHFFFDHANLQGFSDATMTANFAAGTKWHADHNIPISKFVLPHHYEFGTNVFDGLSAWGVEFVGTVVTPGTGYGSHWVMSGPYRRFETGWSSPSVPLYNADFLTVPGRSDLDGRFFNCVTEIRDENDYEWYPTNDVAATIGHGVRQLKRAFDSRVLGTLFTHEYYIPLITAANWRAIMQGVSSGVADDQPISMTMDAACQYVRALATSSISGGTYDASTGTAYTTLVGHTDMTTRFSVFTADGDQIDENYVAVPAFSGSTQIVTSLGTPPGDVIPPVISDVAAGQVTGVAATVTWTTDEAATSQVEYGTTTAYGSTTTFDPTLMTAHGQSISGLAPETEYHYRVLSQDAAGNPAASPDATFTTDSLPTLSIDDVSVNEGNSGTANMTFTVSLSAPSALPVSVAYATANGSALADSDYTAASDALVFAPGVTSQTLSVAVLGDLLDEPDETLAVNLSAAQNATLARSQGVGTIVNDDVAAPSGLTATLQVGPQVALSWTDNATNEDGYVVERAPGGTTAFAVIATPAVNSVAYTDTTVALGSSYVYRVKAVSAISGPSAYSNTAPLTVPTIAAAPSGLSRTITRTTAGPDTVALRWTDNATNETGFTLQRATNAAFTTGLATFRLGANVRTFTNSVPHGATYYYRVQAFNLGGASVWSNTVNVTSVPATPTSFRSMGATRTSITLGWNDDSSNETGYQIQRRQVGGTNWSNVVTTATNATNYTNTGRPAGTAYDYRIRGVNGVGSSPWSPPLRVSTLP